VNPAVVWLECPDHYRQAAAEASPSCLPVLMPEGVRQRRRWPKVIEGQFGSLTVATPGDRLTLAWGSNSASPARVFARLSGSQVAECRSLDAVLSTVAACDERAVVVVAAAFELRVGALVRISQAAHAAGKIVGFLCGRDEAALSYSVVKALLSARASLDGVDLLDAPSHGNHGDATRAAEVRASLTQPSLAKILRSHGEGGHGKLPGVVVCGLLEEVEFAGMAAAGCSRTARRCKRAEASHAAVVFGDEVAAPVLCFVCCNGFNVAGELYPSPVSMALSFIEGWASAVIAPVRPLIAPDQIVEALRERLEAGQPFGAIVADLNEASARIGQPHAFVLHGDPCARLPAARTGTRPSPRRATVDLRDQQRWLVLALHHAERGRRLLRGVAAWLGGPPDGEWRSLWDRLQQMEGILLNALKWSQSDPADNSLRGLRRSVGLARLSIGQWDKEVASLLLGLRQSVDPFDIGHYDQLVISREAGGACARCGTTTEVELFGEGEPARSHRRATLCPVCGPIAEGRVEGLNLIAALGAHVATPGDRFSMAVTVHLPVPSLRIVDTVHLRLRLFDKARDICVWDEARALDAKESEVTFDLDLPGDLAPDLHSVRVVAVCGFDVAYARARFSSLPSKTA
jgi:hypothetical protein